MQKRRNQLNRVLIVWGIVTLLGVTGFHLLIKPKYTVPILMYHHIDYDGDDSCLSVHPENFRRQMRFLSERKYNVISLSEFADTFISQKSLPRNTVVITFDDGYADNFTAAYPVLKKYGLAATIFVMVDALGQDGYLSPEQLKEMVDSGIVEIGSHSLAGAYLPGQDSEQLQQEIGLSKIRLEQMLKRKIDLFCFPIGGFSLEIQQLLKKYGYKAACTTNRGGKQTYLNNDIFALKRIKISDDPFDLFVFWVKLSGYYNMFRRVRTPC